MSAQRLPRATAVLRCTPLRWGYRLVSVYMRGASEQLHGRQSWVDKLHASLGREGRPTVFFLGGGVKWCLVGDSVIQGDFDLFPR